MEGRLIIDCNQLLITASLIAVYISEKRLTHYVINFCTRSCQPHIHKKGQVFLETEGFPVYSMLHVKNLLSQGISLH